MNVNFIWKRERATEGCRAGEGSDQVSDFKKTPQAAMWRIDLE